MQHPALIFIPTNKALRANKALEKLPLSSLTKYVGFHAVLFPAGKAPLGRKGVLAMKAGTVMRTQQGGLITKVRGCFFKAPQKDISRRLKISRRVKKAGMVMQTQQGGLIAKVRSCYHVVFRHLDSSYFWQTMDGQAVFPHICEDAVGKGGGGGLITEARTCSRIASRWCEAVSLWWQQDRSEAVRGLPTFPVHRWRVCGAHENNEGDGYAACSIFPIH